MAFGLRAIAMGMALALVAPGCASRSRMWQARFFAPDSVGGLAASPETPFLKVHLADGRLLILDRWSVDATGRRIAGSGLAFDANRDRVGEGPLEAPLDQLALLEACRPELVTRDSVETMKTMTWVVVGLDAAILGLLLIGGAGGAFGGGSL